MPRTVDARTPTKRTAFRKYRSYDALTFGSAASVSRVRSAGEHGDDIVLDRGPAEIAADGQAKGARAEPHTSSRSAWPPDLGFVPRDPFPPLLRTSGRFVDARSDRRDAGPDAA